MTSAAHPPIHSHRVAHVVVSGLQISAFSSQLLRQLGSEAGLHDVQVTSVHRTVPDQARIFYNKHVIEGKPANYKNQEVASIVTHARALHAEGRSDQHVQSYLIGAIEKVHGGPSSVSTHLGTHVFTEVFDVAHYSGPTTGPARRNLMTSGQAGAFLAACRKRMPSTIARLGHSKELGFVLPTEFCDEKCFPFEVTQLLYDRLEVQSSTRIV